MTTPKNGNHQRRDYRCPTCGRLWFRAYFPSGVVLQIRCPKCNLFYIVGKDTEGLFFRDDNTRQEEKITATNVTKNSERKIDAVS